MANSATSISQPVADPYLFGQNPPSYQSQYSNALDFHNSNYQNILSGYGQSQQNIGQGFAGIAQGYGNLSNQVQGTISGIGASQDQAINDQYAKAGGQANQQLINSGLGNTTVASSVQRGLTLDAQKAHIALANQIAQLTAGYQSQLGSAGLQASAQGLGLQAQGANTQQNVLGGQRLPFPNYPPTGQRTQQQSSGGGGGMGGGTGRSGTNGLWSAGAPGDPNSLQSGYGQAPVNPFAYNPATGQGGNQSGGSTADMNLASGYGSFGGSLLGGAASTQGGYGAGLMGGGGIVQGNNSPYNTNMSGYQAGPFGQNAYSGAGGGDQGGGSSYSSDYSGGD